MTIYNVQRKKLIVQVSSGSDTVFNIEWSKKSNDLRFAAVTVRSLQFWHPADASKKLFKNGTFGAKFDQTRFNCASFDENGLCFSGGANGNIYCWDQRGELGLVLKAHSGECTALVANQGMLVSGGKDNKICVHSVDKGNFEYLRTVSAPAGLAAPTSIDFLDGRILVGHGNGRIGVVAADGAGDYSVESVAHHSGEVWGLEFLP